MTGYRVYPFVGLIAAGHRWAPQASEVERVLEFSLDELVAGHEIKRLVARGFRSRCRPTRWTGTLVWGATGRMVQPCWIGWGRCWPRGEGPRAGLPMCAT